MGAAVKPDEELLEGLDFEVKCGLVVGLAKFAEGRWIITDDMPTRRCDRPAVGFIQCRVCRAESPVCESCRNNVAAQPELMCACGVRGAGLLVYLFIPFRSAS